ERSMPPVRITMVIPTEMQRLTDTCRSTLNILSLVAKFSERNIIATIISNKANSGFVAGLAAKVCRFCFIYTKLYYLFEVMRISR
ncbi:MAG: hypothetical protein IJ880_06770, partial [Bacilli bacterium]|nr:hypothetical protein [Bacilli bacterium]